MVTIGDKLVYLWGRMYTVRIPGYHNNGIGYVIIWITEKEEYVDFMKKYSGYME